MSAITRSASKYLSQTKAAALNTGDIYNALRDPRHNQHGYAITVDLPNSISAESDDLVIQVANEMGLTYEDLFMFLDSKPARWLREDLENKIPVNKSETEVIVRKYLNAREIEELRAELSEPDDPYFSYSSRKTALNVGDKFIFPKNFAGYVQWSGEVARVTDQSMDDGQVALVLDEMWPTGSQSGTGIWVDKAELEAAIEANDPDREI
jgi:hypothetical protein